MKKTKNEKTTKEYFFNEVSKNEVLETLLHYHVKYLQRVMANTKCSKTKKSIKMFFDIIKMREEQLKQLHKVF
jgi:hypothetical protein